MRILLIQDDPERRRMLAGQVRQEFPQATVIEASTAAAADLVSDLDEVELLVTDGAAAGVPRSDLIERIIDRFPDCPIVTFAGSGVIDGGQSGLGLASVVDAPQPGAGERGADRDAERRCRELLRMIPASCCQCSTDGRILDANPSFGDLIGAKDVLGRRLQEFLVEPNQLSSVLAAAQIGAGIEVALRRRDGEQIWTVMRAGTRPGHASIACSFTDITARKEAEERTGALLREKDALIEELYHRVNNNLQILMSFVQQLVRETPDTAARAGLQDLGARIYSLSLVQDQLYRNQNFAEVDLRRYLEELCAARLRGSRIDRTLDLVDLRLPIARAIPIGLIANELLLNAVQHAFRGVAEPRLRVTLDHRQGRHLLRVADNGTGMATDVPPEGYGYRLIRLLAGQIGAEVSIVSEGGTAVTVAFAATG